MYLYIATFPNGKKYVGITTDFCQRRSVHKSRAKLRRDFNLFFYNAINKYGWENIEWNVADGYESWDDLCVLEKETIAALDSNNRDHGYNITEGGDGYCGLTHDSEWKKMMSIRMSGINSPSWGRKLTDKQKRHLSEINSGEKNPRFGKPKTEKQSIAMSEGYQKFCKANGGGWMLGKKMPKEVKLKISVANNGSNNGMYGKRPASAKLTVEQVKEIREKYSSGNYSYEKLAKEYCVGQTTICDIVKRKKYKGIL